MTIELLIDGVQVPMTDRVRLLLKVAAQQAEKSKSYLGTEHITFVLSTYEQFQHLLPITESK